MPAATTSDYRESIHNEPIDTSKEESILLNEDSITQINLYDAAAAAGTNSRKMLHEKTNSMNDETSFESQGAAFQDQDSGVFRVSSEVVDARNTKKLITDDCEVDLAG